MSTTPPIGIGPRGVMAHLEVGVKAGAEVRWSIGLPPISDQSQTAELGGASWSRIRTWRSGAATVAGAKRCWTARAIRCDP